MGTERQRKHHSYRIRWKDRALYFSGDTDDPSALAQEEAGDILFITPWLSCAAVDVEGFTAAGRRIAYPLSPSPGDQMCGEVELLGQGASFTLSARRGG